MKQVFIMTDQSEEPTIDRCNAVKEVLQRIYAVEGQYVEALTPNEINALQALQSLSKAGLLTFRPKTKTETELWYIPSQASRRSVWASEPYLGLTAKILEKHRKKFRTSEGAIFRFPLVGSTNFIEAFITDWSPLPAAAAIAIHRDHTIAREVGKKSGNYFTGRFVRHPLTGDMLPIWVADWVKAEFGTGAVVVNPAHDSTDLEFAQTVGLPIRFALVPQTVSSNPRTWPNPPVIKQGITIKTGRFDGLNTSEAVQSYFVSLRKHGFAEKVTNLSVGALKIASYKISPGGDAVVFEDEGRLEPLGKNDVTRRSQLSLPRCKTITIKLTGLFRSLLSISDEASLDLVVPQAEIGHSLLFARLIWFDLKGQPLVANQIVSVQKVEVTKASQKLARKDFQLASLAKFSLSQVAVIKQQTIDRVTSFNRRHQELLKSARSLSNLTGTPQEKLSKQVVKIKDFILKNDLQNAFSGLFSLQKSIEQLSLEARLEEAAVPGYYTLAYVLTGSQTPEFLNLADIWKGILTTRGKTSQAAIRGNEG